jgi:hypothetical protein
MQQPDLKNEILTEIGRKAYELQIKTGLARNHKIELSDLLISERLLHREIKKLRKLLKQFEKAKKKKEREDLERQIYYELNWQ